MAILSFSHTLLTFFIIFTSIPTILSVSNDVELLLTKIKPSIQGKTENLILNSWNTSTPICQWRGLKWVFDSGAPLLCSDTNSPNWSNLSLFKNPSIHLLSLQLPSANLSGELPPEIGELTQLKSLYLSTNLISGFIPFEIGYSSSLSDLDLGYNLLSGSVPGSIWNLCDKLVSINVHGNLLSGSIPKPGLPNSSCENLINFDFGQNKFSGIFPEFISDFKGLKMVDLSSNSLFGEIPDGLFGLNLEKLNLSYK